MGYKVLFQFKGSFMSGSGLRRSPNGHYGPAIWEKRSAQDVSLTPHGMAMLAAADLFGLPIISLEQAREMVRLSAEAAGLWPECDICQAPAVGYANSGPICQKCYGRICPRIEFQMERY